MKLTYVYWYHLDTHTDKHTEGYIGITHDLATRHWTHSSGRTNEHIAKAFKKYGKDSIIKDILFSGTREECLAYETSLRPYDKIGWNIVKGGGNAPIRSEPHTEATKLKIGNGNRGKNLGKLSPMKGQVNRWTDTMKAHLGSFHKGKVISAEHKQSISAKMSGANSPKAVGIRLYHIDKPHVILEFGSIVEAAKELDINYSGLRSQKNFKRITPNKKGWVILFD